MGRGGHERDGEASTARIVRFWNVAPIPTEAFIRLAQRPAAVFYANLKEEAAEPIAMEQDGRFRIRAGASAIVTLKLYR